MADFKEDLYVLAEYLSAPNVSPASVKLWDELNESYRKNAKSMKTQHLLNKYIQSIGDGVGSASSDFIMGETFKKLSNSGKATVIRDVMGAGIKVGFERAANISQSVYSKILEENGVSRKAVLGNMDEKRFNTIIKIAIGDSLDEEYEKTASFVQGSFAQLIQTGNRRTLAETGYTLRKHGVSVMAKRKTMSSDPCDYCSERNGVVVDVDADGDEVLFKFHDHCHCELELVVNK